MIVYSRSLGDTRRGGHCIMAHSAWCWAATAASSSDVCSERGGRRAVRWASHTWMRTPTSQPRRSRGPGRSPACVWGWPWGAARRRSRVSPAARRWWMAGTWLCWAAAMRRTPWYGHAALAASPILDLPDGELMTRAFADVAAAALARVASPDVRRLLDPPRCRRAEPGGDVRGGLARAGRAHADELVSLLTPLVRHPLALGLSVTIYDPALDPDRSCARQLVRLLEALLVPSAQPQEAAQFRISPSATEAEASARGGR